jgi:hypothetical protein
MSYRQAAVHFRKPFSFHSRNPFSSPARRSEKSTRYLIKKNCDEKGTGESKGKGMLYISIRVYKSMGGNSGSIHMQPWLCCKEDRLKRSRQVFQDSLAISKLLCHETGSGKHGKAAVLKLLGLHDFKFSSVRRLETEGVKAKVSGDVLHAEETGLADGDILGLDKANFSALDLELANDSCKDNPEGDGDLGEVRDGRSLDGRIEKEGRSLNLLADEETNNCKHAYTAVCELGFAVSLQGAFICLGSKAKRVKHTHRGKGTRDSINGEGL